MTPLTRRSPFLHPRPADDRPREQTVLPDAQHVSRDDDGQVVLTSAQRAAVVDAIKKACAKRDGRTNDEVVAPPPGIDANRWALAQAQEILRCGRKARGEE
jgi:hypothetical protein